MLIRLGKSGKAATLDRTASAPATPDKPRASLAELRARFGGPSGEPRRQEVTAAVQATVIEDENGEILPGVRLHCDRCRHAAEAAGLTGASVRRALARLRETCPMGEANWYQAIPEEEALDDPEEAGPPTRPYGGRGQNVGPPPRGGFRRPASTGAPVGKIRIGGGRR